MIDAVREHGAALEGPRPPDPALADGYRRLLAEAGELRGRGLYFPYLGSGLGRGALVELADGSVKLDFISGIGAHVLGHSHPLLIEAGLDAALGDTVMQGNLQMNPEAIELSGLLIELANRRGADLAHCFLSTSGAMANENALKILFQKKSPAARLLAFRGAFAGRTLATCQITDRPEYRNGLPPTVAVDYLPFSDGRDPESSIRATLEALDRQLAAYPGEHAAMICELILGEGGFYPGDKAFFEVLFAKLRERGIPILLDEIQSFGRTGQPFAFQHFGLDRFADVVTIGKMTQVCATLFRSEFNPDAGLLSQTFTASSSAIRAALVILRELRDGGYFGEEGKILRLGQYFAGQLEALAQRFPDRIAGPFGLGGMIGFTPFGGDAGTAREFVKRLFEAGVMVFPAGKNPARVRFLVPYGAAGESEIDQVCESIGRVMEDFQP